MSLAFFSLEGTIAVPVSEGIICSYGSFGRQLSCEPQNLLLANAECGGGAVV